MDKRSTYVTRLGKRKLKVGFLWMEGTIVEVKIAAAKMHMTESAWVETAVLNELKRPQKVEKEKSPFDV